VVDAAETWRPSAQRDAVLQAKDLTLSFGQKVIVAGLSADFRPGAVTALIGRQAWARPRCCAR
jgi:ABC-type branched-subunit amino acid transport system ATPase component